MDKIIFGNPYTIQLYSKCTIHPLLPPHLGFGGLYIEIRLVGLLVVEPVPPPLDMHLLGVVVIEVAVTELTLVSGVRHLDITLH